MANSNNQTKGMIIGLVVGILVTIAVSTFLIGDSKNSGGTTEAEVEKKPLYWVAPMDPNYKSDKPGKSPMGMDLIAFYGNSDGSAQVEKGTIKISPNVINNLGVRTVKVKRQSIHTEIKTVGYVQYDEDSLVHVHPRVEGWIEKLYIKAAGDPVEKGEPLYEMYSPELVNAQEEYLLALGRKNERLINAAQSRLQALQLPNSRINQLRKNRKVDQRVTFYAPQSGVIDNLQIREGNFVKPGNTIMSIGSLNDVWVEAEVFERQANLLKIDQKVTMTLDYIPSKTWTGKVDYVYPTLDAKTRTLKVRLKFNNSDRILKPNMFAQVTIHSYSVDDALLIPSEAVIRTGKSNRVVLSQGDGGFKSINVEIGRYYEEYIEIIGGLNVGDEIVSSAQFLLDSESSKTSDFKRMESNLDIPQTVWVESLINSVIHDHKMINLTHRPIPEWDWPEMTMDFVTTSDVDLNILSPEMNAHVQIEKIKEGQYRVTGVHIPSNDEAETDLSDMDHSKHQMNDESSNQSDVKSMDEEPENDSMDHSINQKIDHSEHKNMNEEGSDKQGGDQ